MDTQLFGPAGEARGWSAPALDRDRRTGRTTRQMQAAPFHAHYVVAHAGARAYTQSLLRELGREDLRIIVIQPRWLDRYIGVFGMVVVIDHDVKLSAEDTERLLASRMTVIPYAG